MAALFFSVAALSLAFAALALLGAVPLSKGAFLLGGGLEQLGPIAFLLYAMLAAALGWSLWARKRGGRRLAVFFAAAGIAIAVPGISSAVVDGRLASIAREGLQIMLRVVVVYYLIQEPVRDWFAS